MLKEKIWKSFISLILTSLLVTAGCKCNNSMFLVCVVDITGSIKDNAKSQAFEALKSIGKNLRRCDSLVIIFVSNDAMTQGHDDILRFHLNENRQAYDADLKNLFDRIQSKLEVVKAKSTASPYTKSDILGAIELAAEEFANASKAAHKVMIGLSDLIVDDSQYNFNRDVRIACEQAAIEFAQSLAQAQTPSFQNVSIYLGLLQSIDMEKLPPNRRSAIQAFWKRYLNLRGASTIISATDGNGQLTGFLKEYAHRP
jgi:hypothetical protein